MYLTAKWTKVQMCGLCKIVLTFLMSICQMDPEFDFAYGPNRIKDQIRAFKN